ncbi:MAG: TIR domain-containing protein [Casimicrobiaceae bacterium]
MKGIFISYRRQDAAGYAGRLYDRLVGHFGAERVFMDVEGIEPGLDFVDAIERAVASCEVLIVIIGLGWLATDNARKRRLDDPKDFVRIETAAALARDIRVVPVLVDGAVMPRAEELPPDLAPLARRQAVELSHKYWDATSAELIRTLERVLDGDKAAGGRKAPVASTPQPAPAEALSPVVDRRDVRHFWMIGGVLALVAAAVGLYLTQPWQEPAAPKAEQAAVAPPAETVAALPSEKTAPTAAKPPAPQVEKGAPLASERTPEPAAEKAAPLPKEKPPAPPAEKAAPRPTEKSATPSVPKTETAAPARAPEKTAAPEPSQAAKPPSVQPPARSPATTSAAPSPRGAETASAPAPPDEKVAAATPAQPIERPSAPVAAAPATTPPVTAPVAPPSALPATLPRVGDTWEYRMRSKWATVEPRTYAHRVTAVSAREVAQTMSVVPGPDGAGVRQAFTSSTRFVEWRGQGFYLLEFNPFLEAFGGLQNPAAISELPAMPAENPFHADWYSRGRIRGSESVTVPAGTFTSLKVEIDSTRRSTESAGMRSREPIRVLLAIWYAPEVKRIVKMTRIVLTPEGMHLDEDTYELVRYRVQ